MRIYLALGFWLAVVPAGGQNIDLAKAHWDTQRVVVSERGVQLADGVEARKEGTPDGVLFLEIPQAGKYRIESTTMAANEAYIEKMKQARNKFDSAFLTLRVEEGLLEERVILAPWKKPEDARHSWGIFSFTKTPGKVEVWLPEGVCLKKLKVTPYVPPTVPEQVKNYEPKIVPPAGHPRLWLRPETEAEVRKNCEVGENREVMERVRRRAKRPVEWKTVSGRKSTHDSNLEQGAQCRALVYRMDGDEAAGREAVALVREYLSRVEFGNVQDITREMGSAIYTGAIVYDWCFSLMTDDDRRIFRENMLRIAEGMEIGWPPFRQSIANGHGSEAQLFRDQLAMGIAIYDEAPETYRYAAYRILEELVPLRRFEYRSARHNQGTSYAGFRVTWELTCALLFEKMTGKRVFDDNILNLRDFFIHRELPDGSRLRDGDFALGPTWQWQSVAFLLSALGRDPVAKGEYLRQVDAGGKSRISDVLFLVLNDPNLQPEQDREKLPTGLDSGDYLAGMVLRTSWTDPAAAVVECFGGGFASANHQHDDAGAFQIYYRGFQAVDLGIHRFYGTPYDTQFNKTALAHNVLLVEDGQGGLGPTRPPRSPLTVRDYLENPEFTTARVLKKGMEPDAFRPKRAWLTVDLTPAYARCVTSYTRSFYWMATGRKEVPVVLVVLDKVHAKDDSFIKSWQLNTLVKPEIVEGTLRADRLVCETLLPRPEEREITSKEAMEGKPYPPPFDAPEAHGWQTRIRAIQNPAVFLNVLQVLDDGAKPLPVEWSETDGSFEIRIDGETVRLP
ncbi:MAG: heparinase II/III family protein [Planctomycetia bacterium]|nr:heparinase II/III family protein [Planctomycetia bacterium]